MLMQFAGRTGLGDLDLGGVVSWLAVYKKRTGLTPYLVNWNFVHIQQDAVQTQAQQTASQSQAPAPAWQPTPIPAVTTEPQAMALQQDDRSSYGQSTRPGRRL